VSGTPPLGYQWFKADGTPILMPRPDLQLPSVTPTDAGGYYVVVTNMAGTATSLTVTLTVTGALSITTQPQTSP